MECRAISIKSEGGPELFDPARLPPRIYLEDVLCKSATIKEIGDLLKPGEDGICPLRLVRRDCEECRGIRYIRASLAVRWKGPLRAKARLCLRGGAVHSSGVFSSPTPYLSSLKTFLFLAGIFQMQVLCVDISQAIVQSSSVARSDRFLIEPPDCLEMIWKGGVNDGADSKTRRSDYVFIMAKPLYGLHDSPLRWFISL